MKKALLFLFLFAVLSNLTLAQNTFKVMGKVTDTKGEALIGANVYIKALNTGGATDVEGNYSFEVPKDLATGQQVELSVSYIGYKPAAVTIVLTGNSIQQNFSLEEDIFQSEEIVVTGIASKTSKSVAEVAVGRVSAAQLQQINTYGSLSNLVSGKISGVQVTNASGNIGGGWRFFVRGGGGLNGDGQPIIYVDGVRVENREIGRATGGQLNSTLAGLNTNDIEKIEFLKGPAASAMYGANGSNGVVLITTKSGTLVPGGRQGLSVEYKFNYGNNEIQEKYKTDNFISANDANDMFKVGPLREHYLTVAGGSQALRYFTSLETRNQEGIMETNSEDRTTFRVNVISYPYNNLTLRLNSYYVNNNVYRPNNDNSIYGILGNVLLRPTSFAWTAKDKLIQAVSQGVTNQFIGSVNALYSPIDNMELNLTVGMDNSSYRENRFYPLGFNALIPSGQKTLTQRNNSQVNADFNASYSYTLFDDINVRSIIGSQIFNRVYKEFYTTGQDFNSDLITDLGSTGTIVEWVEGFSNSRDGGIFTEHSFSYLQQYFLTLGIRRDYATAIGKNAPAVTYPKASFAIRLDKYDFLPDFFDLLKVRVAYGEGGVLPGSTAGIPLLWTAEPGAYGAGATLISIGNDEIEPERIKNLELGFDTEFLKSFSYEFTYYREWAEKSIVDRRLAGSTGKTITAQPFNVGSIKGWGFEQLLQYTPIRGSDYNLDLSLIWNYQTNKVESLGGEADIFSDPNSVAVGYPKYQFYTFISEGARYDATGKYAGSIKSAKRVDLGSPIPDHSGSFTINFRFLRDFNLYVFAEWGLNNKVYNMTQLFANRYGNNKEYNDMKAQLGLAGGTAGVAALTPGTNEYKAVAEKYAKLDYLNYGNYIQDAEYLAIREVSLSYDFTEMLRTLDFSNYIKYFTLGVSATNLARFTPYKGADIGTNYNGARTTVSRSQDFLTLPTYRTINFWLRLGL